MAASRACLAAALAAAVLLAAAFVDARPIGKSAATSELSGTVTARRRPENDRGKTCDVRDFGAIGDGVAKDTQAIKQAIAVCGADSVILFPAPGQYLTAPFNLTSYMTLRIEPGAALLASDALADWFIVAPLPSYPNGREESGPRYVSFIGGYEVVDVAIDGGGLIDGQGEQWYLRHWNEELEYDRGRLIEPMFCRNFRLTDIYILNPMFWAVHPYACDQVLVENVDIRAPIASPNTDGIDPDSTTNVVIRGEGGDTCELWRALFATDSNCTVNNSDDHIAIKSGFNEGGREFGRPSANILVEDCVFGYGDGVAVGSETSGGVFNVTVRNSVFTGMSLRTLRVKTARGRGNVVENITFSDIEILGLHGVALTVDMLFESSGSADANRARRHVPTRGGYIGSPWPVPVSARVTLYWSAREKVIPQRPLTCNSYVCSESADVELVDINIETRLPFVCENAYGSATRVQPASCLDSGVPTRDDQVEEALRDVEQTILARKAQDRLVRFGF